MPKDSKGNPMVVVDEQNFMIKWSPYLSSEIIKPWIYYYVEQSDYDSTKFDEDLPSFVSSFFTFFTHFGISNRVFKLSPSRFWSYEIKKPVNSYDHKITVECLSKVCPDFIHYSTTNHTFWSDFR
jgi:hypothetical protein